MRTKDLSRLFIVATVTVFAAAAVADPAASPPGAAKTPEPAPPSELAKLPPPQVPQPAPLTTATGFGTAGLAPFATLLPASEQATLEHLAQAVLASPYAGVVRELASQLAAERKMVDDEAKTEPEERDLVAFTMPNDPMLLLGAAKSFDGLITASPRLVRDALLPPPPPAGATPAASPAKPATPEDEWIYQNPEQACTSGLSYALVPQGSVFSELESLPAPSGLDVHRMNLLYAIESNPSPLLRTGAFANADSDVTGDPADADAASAAGLDAEVLSEGLSRSDPYALARTKELPLGEFLALAKAALDPGDRLAATLFQRLEALAAATQPLRRACLAAGNRWTWTRSASSGHEDVSLFACRTPGGQAAGPSARLLLQGGDYPYGLVVAADDAPTGLGVELRLAFDREFVKLSARRDQEPHGPTLIWATTGQALALDLALTPAEAARTSDEYDVYEWYPNGAVKLVGHRRGGKPAGSERSWYAGGALAGQVDYDDKGMMKLYREWFENHRPAEETPLKLGKMAGLRRWWHMSGMPAGEAVYEAGEPHGALTLWYEDGTKGVAATFQHAQLDGETAWWYEDGSPLYHGRFKTGRPDGEHKLFLASGATLSERHFADGQPLGTWTSYNQYGKPLREVTFKSGQKDGKAVLRYKNGAAFLELAWKEGLLDGPLKTFYPDGQLAATCLYERDMLVQFSRWYPTGEPALEGKVLDQDRGVVNFTALRRDGSASVECVMSGYEMDRCKLFDKSGQEIHLPDTNALAAQLKAPESGVALAWEPERCGGYKLHVNYDALINNQGGKIFANFDTNHECPDQTLGGALSCVLTLEQGRLKSDGCVVGSASDAGQLPDMTTPAALTH